MKTFVKRLQSLEAGQGLGYHHLSDEELVDRMNEITLELRPFGFDFPMLDGGPQDAERLRVTEKMLRSVTY